MSLRLRSSGTPGTTDSLLSCFSVSRLSSRLSSSRFKSRHSSSHVLVLERRWDLCSSRISFGSGPGYSTSDCGFGGQGFYGGLGALGLSSSHSPGAPRLDDEDDGGDEDGDE